MPQSKAAAASSASSLVRELADILNETGLTEIEVERDGQRIRVAKTAGPSFAQAIAGPTPIAAAPPPPAAEPPAAEPPLYRAAGETVTSPMVGTIYLQPQ